MKKMMATGLLAASLVGGTAGTAIYGFAAGAQDDTTTVAPTDDTTPATAAPDASTDATRPEPGAAMRDALQGLVEDGTLTQEQLDKVIATLEAARPEGDMGRRGHRGPGGPGREHMTEVAEALNLDPMDLAQKLRDGSTLAEIAGEQGVDPQTIIDILVDGAKTHLDEEVTEGDLTQDEADAKLAEITTRITDSVNNGGPLANGGPRGRGHHDDAQADESGTADVTAPEAEGASLSA